MREEGGDEAVPATIPIQRALWPVPESAPSGVLIWVGHNEGRRPLVMGTRSSQIQTPMAIQAGRTPEHCQRWHFMFWLFHALMLGGPRLA